jgi:hypothetical protein
MHGDSSETDALDNLETIATITGEQVVLVFRKNISGITQRLGEIALTKDEDIEIDPTAWAGIAVTRATNLEQEVRDLTVKYNEQGNTIQKLNQQLEDLVEAKIQHETALLEKFRELLNAKKLKIRDQQRLLASAKVDPQKGNQPLSTHRSIIPTLNPLPNAADHIHTTRHAPTPHIPTASRPTKRKPSPSPSPSSSDFDNRQKQESPATPAQATPEHSELDATEDEDSDNLDSAPAPPSQGLGAKGKVVENAEESGDEDKIARKPSPPPRRELPFPRKAGRGGEIMGQQAMKSEPAEAMDEDGDRGGEETSDDEL